MIKLCAFCDGPFEYDPTKQGRPKLYCSDKCRRLAVDERARLCDVPGCTVKPKRHTHCPECGSIEHVAETCDMMG